MCKQCQLISDHRARIGGGEGREAEQARAGILQQVSPHKLSVPQLHPVTVLHEQECRSKACETETNTIFHLLLRLYLNH